MFDDARSLREIHWLLSLHELVDFVFALPGLGVRYRGVGDRQWDHFPRSFSSLLVLVCAALRRRAQWK